MRFSGKLTTHLLDARSVCVLTGAGVSAESGVPTFRDKGGIWEKYRPEELASFDAFMANPDRVWEWYSMRRSVLRDVEPNPAHHALVELEKLVPEFTLVTQNVDNLHQRAGNSRVLELHGNLERNYCVDCRHDWDDPAYDPSSAKETPRCSVCGGLVRPDVVWFGEMLPMDILAEAEQKARQCDVFLTIGTAGVVYPAAGLPILAYQQGAFTVEFNREKTELSSIMSESYIAPSGVSLPELVNTMQAIRKS